MLGGTLTIRNGEIQAGEWLFPAVLLANLDLEPINLADQFFSTYLSGDISPMNAGSLTPVTAHLGLGFLVFKAHRLLYLLYQLKAQGYKGTSSIRKCPPPSNLPRTLGICLR